MKGIIARIEEATHKAMNQPPITKESLTKLLDDMQHNDLQNRRRK